MCLNCGQELNTANMRPLSTWTKIGVTYHLVTPIGGLPQSNNVVFCETDEVIGDTEGNLPPRHVRQITTGHAQQFSHSKDLELPEHRNVVRVIFPIAVSVGCIDTSEPITDEWKIEFLVRGMRSG